MEQGNQKYAEEERENISEKTKMICCSVGVP